jgi:hypothetical protein
MQNIVRGFSAFVVLTVFYFWSSYALMSVSASKDNAAYAGRVFDQIVPYKAVLASNQWMPVTFDQTLPGYGLGQMTGGGGQNFCRFAVVQLSANASATPPLLPVTSSSDPHNPPFDFVGEWMATPAPPLDTGDTRYRHSCEPEIGSLVVDQMIEALSKPGGWWHGSAGAFDGVLFVYSKPENLAFRLSYGD